MIEFARFGSRLGDHLRAVIVASPDADGPELPGFALYHDAKRCMFALSIVLDDSDFDKLADAVDEFAETRALCASVGPALPAR
jgi:hypothetical protein